MIVLATTRRRWPALGRSMPLMFIALASAISWGWPKDNRTNSQMQRVAHARDTVTDGDEIRRIIAKYAQSVDEADPTLASQIWWNSPEVSFIHPLGHEHGFDEIKQNVYGRLMGDTFSERKLSIHDIAVHLYGDAAWAEFYWDFAAMFRKDGSPLTTHGRETQVYRNYEGRWRLVHVHYSGMPVTPERKGF